jgi:hypothetical protein
VRWSITRAFIASAPQSTEEPGAIRRTPHDGRGSLVELSDKARNDLGAGRDSLQQSNIEITEGFSNSEMKALTGAFKNALDQAYKEWNRKPFTAIAYGGVGGARALEHLRAVGVELQMVSTRSAVHIGGRDFMSVFPMGGNKPIEEIEDSLLPSGKAALDELVWWANATRAAKA